MPCLKRGLNGLQADASACADDKHCRHRVDAPGQIRPLTYAMTPTTSHGTGCGRGRGTVYFSENRQNRQNRRNTWTIKDLRLAAARRAAATSARRRARHGAFSPARHPAGSVAVTASIEGGCWRPLEPGLPERHGQSAIRATVVRALVLTAAFAAALTPVTCL